MIRDYMKLPEGEASQNLKAVIQETAETLQNVVDNEDYKSHGSIYDPLALPLHLQFGNSHP